MKPIILDDTKSLQALASDNTEGLGRVSNIANPYVKEEANGPYEAEFEVSITDPHFADLHNGGILKIKPNETDDNQLFRIYQIDKPIKGLATVHLEHISYDTNKIAVAPFTATGAAAGFVALASHIMGQYPFTFYTDITNSTTKITLVQPAHVRSVLGGVEGSFLDQFGGEYKWDNLQISLLAHRGQDNGVRISYGKNLIDYRQEINNQSVFTAVVGYATKNDITTVGNVVPAVESSAHRAKIVDFSGDFDEGEEITVAKVDARSRAFIAANNIGEPNINIEIEFVHLWQTQEYKTLAALERVALFDTVHVFIPKLGVETSAKVVSTTYNFMTERYEKIELGNVKATFGEVIDTAVEEKTEQAISIMDAAISYATEMITGGKGGYIVIERNADGFPEELLIMDTPDKSTAVNVWRFNKNGLGHSHNGYDGPYSDIALTADGKINASMITTGTLNANVIRAGIIADKQGKNSWNLDSGEFSLHAGTTIGGETIDEITGAALDDFADTVLDPAIQGLQDQIDGAITTWYYDYVPTLSNAPANTWTTDTEKNNHIGDLFYNKSTGYCYRFMLDNGTYKWVQISDEDISEALAVASAAQDTADSKRRVFVAQPVPPYDIGDLWAQGSTGDIYKCKTAKTATQTYAAADWEKASKYTDNTVANQALALAQGAISGVDVEYAQSQSPTTAPTTGWQTTAPTWREGYYIWQRTATTTSQGTTYSNPTCISGREGTDGTSVTVASIRYGVSNSETTTPTTWYNEAPTLAAGQWLWVKTEYSDGSQAMAKSYAGTNGQKGDKGDKGTDGTSVTISSILYADSTSGTVTPTSWGTSIPSPVKGHWLWVKTTYSDSSEAITKSYMGDDGTPGANGINTATIYLYQRAASTPAKPTESLTYTFASAELSGNPGNWTRNIPSGTAPCYVIAATAASSSATDTIAPNEWSAQVVIAENGSDGPRGLPGADGLSQATIYLYQRAASAPSTPIVSTTYTFASGVLSPIPTGWSRGVPTGTDPCYMTSAAAISSESTATIESSAWSAVSKLVENGQKGDTGKGVSAIVEQYYLSTSDQSPTGGSWSTSQPTWESGKYIWTRSAVTWTDSTTTYTTPVLAEAYNQAFEQISENTADIEVNEGNINMLTRRTTKYANLLTNSNFSNVENHMTHWTMYGAADGTAAYITDADFKRADGFCLQITKDGTSQAGGYYFEQTFTVNKNLYGRTLWILFDYKIISASKTSNQLVLNIRANTTSSDTWQTLKNEYINTSTEYYGMLMNYRKSVAINIDDTIKQMKVRIPYPYGTDLATYRINNMMLMLTDATDGTPAYGTWSDFAKMDLVSQINMSPDGVKIAGEKIDIYGLTTFHSADGTGSTTIDGARMTWYGGTANEATLDKQNINFGGESFSGIKIASKAIMLDTSGGDGIVWLNSKNAWIVVSKEHIGISKTNGGGITVNDDGVMVQTEIPNGQLINDYLTWRRVVGTDGNNYYALTARNY